MYRPEYPRLKVRLFPVSAGAWVQQQRRSAWSALGQHRCCQHLGAADGGVWPDDVTQGGACLQSDLLRTLLKSTACSAATCVTCADTVLQMQATVLQG
jgi:hypothetical protein